MRWGNGTHSTQSFGSLPGEDTKFIPLLTAVHSGDGQFHYGNNWCVDHDENALIITNNAEGRTDIGASAKHTRLTGKGMVMQTTYRARDGKDKVVCHAFPRGGLPTPAEVASIEEGLAYLARHEAWEAAA